MGAVRLFAKGWSDLDHYERVALVLTLIPTLGLLFATADLLGHAEPHLLPSDAPWSAHLTTLVLLLIGWRILFVDRILVRFSGRLFLYIRSWLPGGTWAQQALTMSEDT